MARIYGTNYDADDPANIASIEKMTAFFDATNSLLSRYISDEYPTSNALKQVTKHYVSSLLQTAVSIRQSGCDFFQFKDRYRRQLLNAFTDAALPTVGQTLAKEIDSAAIEHLGIPAPRR